MGKFDADQFFLGEQLNTYIGTIYYIQKTILNLCDNHNMILIVKVSLNDFILLLPESKFKVKTKTIAADFSKGPPVFDVIEEELRDIPVGILGTVCINAWV
jgi:hypothetical protein